MRTNYYEILGIRENASIEEIRKAYKRLAKKFHPDVNAHDPLANERFKEIVHAYEALCDPHRQAAYFSASAEARPPDDERERAYLYMMMEMFMQRNPRGRR